MQSPPSPQPPSKNNNPDNTSNKPQKNRNQPPRNAPPDPKTGIRAKYEWSQLFPINRKKLA